MALNVGGVTLTRLVPPEDQPIPELATAVETYERVGVDGTGVRSVGRRGAPVVWRYYCDEASASAAKTKRSALLALRGTIVNTEDVWGTVEDHVLVEQVEPPRQRVVLVAGATTYRVEGALILRKVAD